MESSSSSSKRGKAPGSISQVGHCLVDGCDADLRLCRDYHRRHKVCEVHSKTPKVSIAGREQRFCQQCSRFHSLVEFDEGKRSCRKRLDGHNRRRRKPQPESLSRNPGQQRLLSFSSPQIVPSDMPLLYNTNQHSVNNYNNNYIERQFRHSESTCSYSGALSLLSSGFYNPYFHSASSSQYPNFGGSSVVSASADQSFQHHGSSTATGSPNQTLTFMSD